jgi:hypothetical protein
MPREPATRAASSIVLTPSEAIHVVTADTPVGMATFSTKPISICSGSRPIKPAENIASPNAPSPVPIK